MRPDSIDESTAASIWGAGAGVWAGVGADGCHAAGLPHASEHKRRSVKILSPTPTPPTPSPQPPASRPPALERPRHERPRHAHQLGAPRGLLCVHPPRVVPLLAAMIRARAAAAAGAVAAAAALLAGAAAARRARGVPNALDEGAEQVGHAPLRSGCGRSRVGGTRPSSTRRRGWRAGAPRGRLRCRALARRPL
jgi:hypothetical protein